VAEWLALSDRPTPLAAAEGMALLTKATLVLEFELPLDGATILLDFKTEGNSQAPQGPTGFLSFLM